MDVKYDLEEALSGSATFLDLLFILWKNCMAQIGTTTEI